MKLFKWIDGRQHSGYRKMMLCYSNLLKFDMYLIHYPPNSEVPPHKDLVDNGKHYRLNIILKKSKIGGEFICEKAIIENSRIILFRPDLYEHSVKKIINGNRYVLSIGWIKNE